MIKLFNVEVLYMVLNFQCLVDFYQEGIEKQVLGMIVRESKRMSLLLSSASS